MNVVFPEQFQKRNALDMDWAKRADITLQRYAGWLWSDEDGDPDVPGWAGDLWRSYVSGVRRHARSIEDVDWTRHWAKFFDLMMTGDDPRWREQVALMLGEAA